MAVRIAIPVPTSSDPEYNQRSLPPYVDALKAAGAEPVVVPLNEPQERVARLLAGVQGVLLPGSRYDVDPNGMVRRELLSAARPIPRALRQTSFCCKTPSTCASPSSPSVTARKH